MDATDAISCRPDFAIIRYPDHIWAHKDEDEGSRDASDLKLRKDIRVSPQTPPTCIVHAEDDTTDSVQQSLAYYIAILAEKQDITPTMALRIGKLIGTTHERWVHMQRNHDLHVQSAKDAEIIARIPTLEAT